jgi:NADH-quinone oxidoreductase subunit C
MVGLTAEIGERFPGALSEIVEYQGETTLVVEAMRAKELLRFLKAEKGFNFLADLSCAHWPEEGRIDVVYQVRNLKTREQFRVRAALPVEDPAIATVSDVWRTADWLEREVYDLMGIVFTGHPDLRRIMLPEDFDGHPLRKEFPMEGDDEWRNYLPPSGSPDE